MKMYIVFGSTHNDDTRREWVVCGYKNKEKAIEHCEKAYERGKEINSQAVDMFHWYSLMDEKLNEYDEYYYCDYLDLVSYYIIETEILD